MFSSLGNLSALAKILGKAHATKFFDAAFSSRELHQISLDQIAQIFSMKI
jgi:hypothetical protein